MSRDSKPTDKKRPKSRAKPRSRSRAKSQKTVGKRSRGWSRLALVLLIVGCLVTGWKVGGGTVIQPYWDEHVLSRWITWSRQLEELPVIRSVREAYASRRSTEKNPVSSESRSNPAILSSDPLPPPPYPIPGGSPAFYPDGPTAPGVRTLPNHKPTETRNDVAALQTQPASVAHPDIQAIDLAIDQVALDAVPDLPGVQNALEAQVALTSHGISSGSLDGLWGEQTAAALRAFQMQQGLEQTGRLDLETRQHLIMEGPLLVTRRIQALDIGDLTQIPSTWLAKSLAPALNHETLLERIAEQHHAHPRLILELNPDINWNFVRLGMVCQVPNVQFPAPRMAARIRISLSGRYLRAFDHEGNLLAHFPCSIGRVAERRPVGDLHVTVVVENPDYTFNPRIFPDSEEGRTLGRRLILPPGGNNPVGVAWIGLDRPGFGIHGTPEPELVGRTESSGCFRLANWNADYLRQLVWVGLPVSVEH